MDEDTLFDHDWDDKHIIDIEWDNPNHEAETEMHQMGVISAP